MYEVVGTDGRNGRRGRGRHGYHSPLGGRNVKSRQELVTYYLDKVTQWLMTGFKVGAGGRCFPCDAYQRSTCRDRAGDRGKHRLKMKMTRELIRTRFVRMAAV